MDGLIKPSPKGKGRKKKSMPEEWARNKAKIKRHQAKGLPQYPTCEHRGKKTFRCKYLKMEDIRAFHGNFYKTSDKIVQDFYILKHIDAKEPENKKSGTKSVSINYFVKVKSCKSFRLQVCQKAFLGILNVSKDRVQRIARNHFKTGEMPKETRGGDRMAPKFADKKKCVRNFIELLKYSSEAHYCRGKSIARQYLPGNLSIAKLYKAYNDKSLDHLKVKRSFFRNIFTSEYNIGFGIPVTDVCSTCSGFKESIKHEKDSGKRAKIIIDLRIHKLRAKAFFDKLKEENEGLETFSFDCQKNLVIPKVADQAAYYSRQLYTYNFTVVRGSSKAKMTKENTIIYTWNENEYAKDSNAICSSVFHSLNLFDLSKCTKLRLCADGCGGQNRNSTMICMCSYYLMNFAPPNITEIELVFPIPGHSYMPSDCVFGRIEKVLKTIPVINNPQEYVDVFNMHRTVYKLGTNYTIYDWKEATKTYYKPVKDWHFKFAPSKRFVFTKSKSAKAVFVRGEVYYKSNLGSGKSLLKKGMRLNCILLSEVPRGQPVKPAKVKDIENLLIKHYGENWRNVPGNDFLKSFLDNDVIVGDDDAPDTPGEFCEPHEEDILVRV